MQKIQVVDAATMAPIEVSVPAERYRAYDEWMATEGKRLVGDTHPETGRRITGLDATEALAFLVSELTYVENIVLPRYYQPMQYDKALAGCIDFSAGEHVTSITYEIFDMVGNAQDADSGADDIPYADVAYARQTFGVGHGFAGFQYTQQELRTTAFLRRPLQETRMQTAVQMFQRKINNSALLGNAAKNFTGLLNNGNVTHASTPSGQNWHGGATPAQIFSDFAFGMYSVWTQSGFNKIPTAVGVTPLAYEYMDTTPASSSIPTVSILEWLRKNNICKSILGQELDIFPLYDAAAAGAGGTGRVVFYVRENDTMVLHIPMSLRFLAPQLVNVKIKVPGEFRYSGVAIRRPTNVYYMDGV
jgi:hypothetical protein